MGSRTGTQFIAPSEIRFGPLRPIFVQIDCKKATNDSSSSDVKVRLS